MKHGEAKWGAKAASRRWWRTSTTWLMWLKAAGANGASTKLALETVTGSSRQRLRRLAGPLEDALRQALNGGGR